MKTINTNKQKSVYRRQLKILLEGLAGLIILLTVVSAARAQVHISQVLYDPQGTQTGGEFVLLENKGDSIVQIGGWALATGASMRDVVFPVGTKIDAGSTLLVADKGWNESRDNSTWPGADLEDVMTLASVNSGVALMMNETVIDAVGWGNVTNGLLFKGNASAPALKGQSLRRISYIGSNDADFVAGYPQFALSGPIGGVEITINVIEPENPPGLTLVTEDDDPSTGTQLIPFPGMTRKVTVNVTITGMTLDDVLIDHWGLNTTLLKQSGANNTFRGEIDLPYRLIPGTYTIRADGRRSGTVVSSASITAQIKPVVSVSLDSVSLPFGEVIAGPNQVILGDENISTTDRPTIWNSGNVPAGITMTGSDLDGPSSGIPAANIQATLRRSSEAIDTIGLSRSPQELGVILEVGALAALDLSIQIPRSQAGKYSGRIWLVATGGE